jgi:uncharacterized membrane protein (DUF106 family)
MAALNALLREIFDRVLAPMSAWPPLAAIAVVSLPVAVFMLWVFKRTSDQKGLEAVKRQIFACLFEIRLYNDDLRAILRAQAEILRHNARYLRLSLPPLLWMIVPLVLLIAQLQFHYGYSPLEPGAIAIVKVELRESGAKPEVVLESAGGVRVETPAVWIPSLRELSWRIRAEQPGEHRLSVRVAEASESKAVRVGGGLARLSPLRVSPGWLDQLLYPAEPPLPRDGPIASIAVAYPGRDVDVFGWGMNWLVVFFVLSIAFAFVLRRPLGVTI